MSMNNFCEFVDIGLNNYQCAKCSTIVESDDGAPVFLCSYIDSMVPSSDIEKELFCTVSQIENRYNICKTCEHFKDNTCAQCGCRVVRNSEFKNKLFFKHQECPIGKWKKES